VNKEHQTKQQIVTLRKENERLRSALRVIHTWINFKDHNGFRSALDLDQITEKIDEVLRK